MGNRSFKGRLTRGLGTGDWRLAKGGTQSPRSWQSKSVLFAVFAAFAFLEIVGGAQQPTERALTEALARRATERLQALQREADRMASDERTLLGDLRNAGIRFADLETSQSSLEDIFVSLVRRT